MIKTRRDALATLGIMGLSSAVPQLIKRALASSPGGVTSTRIPVDGLEKTLTPAGVNSDRIEWWRAAKLGMFVHWDPSSLAGTEISWSRKGSKPLDITGDPAGYVEDPLYDHLYQRFNPVHFDADQWLQIARNGGARCRDDCQASRWLLHVEYEVHQLQHYEHALQKRCHQGNLRSVSSRGHALWKIYYSPRDWHHPGYGIGDNKKYVTHMNGEIRELLTNYGKVDIVWFDSYGRGDLVNFCNVGATFDLIKSLQPDILINNRLTVLADYDKQPGPYLGDFDTPEQRIGAFQASRAWDPARRS